MQVSRFHAGTSVPFCVARAFIAQYRSEIYRSSGLGVHLRSVTHEIPDGELSLSDRQSPGEQLRFYTMHRIVRGWRYVGSVLKETLGSAHVIIMGDLHPADRTFFDALRVGGMDLHIEYHPSDAAPDEDSESDKYEALVANYRQGGETPRALKGSLEELLALGDSWTAAWVADELSLAQGAGDAGVATAAALAYGLQERNAEAESLFREWEASGGLEAARARYSLAMMYARHHSSDLLDQQVAWDYLESAYSILMELPDEEAVLYERVFNRNGMALLLFRAKHFQEAADLLEDGIATLEGSPWGRALHHTVLLNNLGRVYAAMDDSHRAEEVLREAISIDPRFAEYHQDLASFLVDQGRHEEARAVVGEALSIDPSVPELYELSGYLEAARGNNGEAARLYEASWRLGSDAAGLPLLRSLSETEEYERVLDLIREERWASLPTEDLAEIGIISIEASSMLDRDFDVEAALSELAQKYPESELIKLNVAEVEVRA